MVAAFFIGSVVIAGKCGPCQSNAVRARWPAGKEGVEAANLLHEELGLLPGDIPQPPPSLRVGTQVPQGSPASGHEEKDRNRGQQVRLDGGKARGNDHTDSS
jgi:hypothetical protein